VMNPPPSEPPTSAPTVDCAGQNFRLSLKTDNYGSETGFTLEYPDGSTWDMPQPLGNNKLQNYSPRCLDPGEYKFTITDSYGDGICCSYGEGFYEIKVGGGVIKTGGQFDSVETTTFDVDAGTPPQPTPTSPPQPTPTTPPQPTPTTPPQPTPTNPPINCDTNLFKMTVVTDASGGDTSYVLATSDGSVVLSNTDLLDDNTYVEEACLVEGERYVYTITDVNGICCTNGDGSYLLTLDGKVLNNGGSFTEYETVIFRTA